MQERKWKIIGLMSGTSLDGLDVALCEFVTDGKELKSFQIISATTYSYSEEEINRLSLMEASALALAEADAWFGRLCGQKVVEFLEGIGEKVDLVASHGHTVFHQPHRLFTTQIGDGAALSAICGLPVVSDFRTMDIALAGQGAPLVPIGDLLLFPEYQFCLNLGGIANISVKRAEGIVAYDICPANMALNNVARDIGLSFDADGKLASKGEVHRGLLMHLESLDYYRLHYPKSLGKEWFDTIFLPVLSSYAISMEDKSRTLCEHIAAQIASAVQKDLGILPAKMLITGGGAFHHFLVERIVEMLDDKCKVEIPMVNMVSFKEALIFAFLGLRRIQNEPNSLRSVTGARYDSIGGALYGNFQGLWS